MLLGAIESVVVVGLVIFGAIMFIRWAINEGNKRS
jgi:hypothetical protein